MKTPISEFHMQLVLRLIFLSLFTTYSWSFEAPDTESIHVGLTDSYPWAYESEGKITGIYPELLELVEQNTSGDLRFSLQLLPLKRILAQMENAKFPTSLTFMSYKTGRAERMSPLVKVYRTPFIILSHADNPISSLENIANKDIAMLLGGSGCPCLGDETTYQRVRLSHHKMGLKMLEKKRVDGVAGPSIRLYELANQLNFRNILAPPVTYEWRSVWMWGSKSKKTSADITEALKKQIEMLIKNGELTRLASKYLLPSQLNFMEYNE
jgi:ABC-type amino acid transport substrate-binding protein